MKQSITIAWLYPSLMSTYGDRGNITVLQKRLAWRGIAAKIMPIDQGDSLKSLKDAHLIMMGGAQDVQQEIVMAQMKHEKTLLADAIEKGVPGLFVCGAYQFLGEYYETADGVQIPGLGIFPLFTKSTHDAPRLIGNVSAECALPGLEKTALIGFENHGGRTHFTQTGASAFAQVRKGYGNNGEDQLEGMVYQNAIGTYLHGPLLPKNPFVADWLLSRAVRFATGTDIVLDPLPALCEVEASAYVVNNRL